MKKLFTLACTLALGGALSFAQAAGSASSSQTPATGSSQTPASTDTATSGKQKTKKE